MSTITEKRVEEVTLRREIGLLGSFAMGFADVGADVFLAIGIVTLYAAGYAPLAFLIASVCYISTGLVYAELSTLYPYAGGGQVFGMRAGGDLIGFLTGWAILLDYVLDIGLFSITSAGYLAYVIPWLNGYLALRLYGYVFKISKIGLTAFTLVLFLIAINLIGIKESSRFNEILVVLTISAELLVLSLAYPFSFNPIRFIQQFKYFGNPVKLEHVFYTNFLKTNVENFIYGVTLAMSSFIGIESIAQAAEETRNPRRYLPRAFKYSIVMVLLFTMLFSILGLGTLGWRGLSKVIYNPIAVIASKIPYIGHILALYVAVVAFLISLVSTNTGIIGVSRVTYSMSRFKLIPSTFSKLHRKRAVPYVSIIFFGLIGGAFALTGNLEMVAGLYNFGALLSYLLVNYSHLKLRVIDRDVYRPWLTPLNVRYKDTEISILSIIGMLSTGLLFSLIILYHPEGRLLGLLWILIGILIFTSYRKYHGWRITEPISVRMMKPVITKIKTIVLIPPYMNSELAYKAIYYNIDTIHDLILLSYIQIPHKYGEEVKLNWMEIYRFKKDLEQVLSDMCDKLRRNGYRCSYYVIVGTSESIIRYINSAKVDTVALICGKKPRVKSNKGVFSTNIKKDVNILYLYIPEAG